MLDQKVLMTTTLEDTETLTLVQSGDIFKITVTDNLGVACGGFYEKRATKREAIALYMAIIGSDEELVACTTRGELV